MCFACNDFVPRCGRGYIRNIGVKFRQFLLLTFSFISQKLDVQLAEILSRVREGIVYPVHPIPCWCSGRSQSISSKVIDPILWDYSDFSTSAWGLRCKLHQCAVFTTATWRSCNPFSQWERSFQWKLRSHWLKVLRKCYIAIVIKDPGPRLNIRKDVFS